MENLLDKLKFLKSLKIDKNILKNCHDNILWTKKEKIFVFLGGFMIISLMCIITLMFTTTIVFDEAFRSYMNNFENKEKAVSNVFLSMFVIGFVINCIIYPTILLKNRKMKDKYFVLVKDLKEKYKFSNEFSIKDFRDFTNNEINAFFNRENSRVLLLNIRKQDSAFNEYRDFILENTRFLEESDKEEEILNKINRRLGKETEGLKIIEES